MSLATYRHTIDEDKKALRKVLHDEILAYQKLTEAWGLGHIQCTIKKCSLKYNECPGTVVGNEKHLVIRGYYVDNGKGMQMETIHQW